MLNITRDFADEYPSAQVIGTDLSPTQPNFVPANLQFEVDDCCDTWTFSENSFDYIHVRGLYGCVADWPLFYKQAYKCLKPGAYLEQAEMDITFKCEDNSVPPESAMGRWGPTFLGAAEKFGKSLSIATEMKGHIENAGFVDVVERTIKMPVGPWSSNRRLKEVGLWNQLMCEESIEMWALAMATRILGWDLTKTRLFLAEMRKNLRDRSMHSYFDWVIVTARKPEEKAE
ncbi:MAG: hypothetical protein M1833_003570 [Piccolia ochrophora]|nr:MAG: hypothetical protein M1833_003570 [Piccolia ochrophora]